MQDPDQPLASTKCYLYRAVNTVNGKAYIGITMYPDKRWRQHKRDSRSAKAVENNKAPLFYAAARKYGWDAFKWQILAICRNSVAAGKLEMLAIALGMGHYNVLPGGTTGRTGLKHSEATRKKIADLQRGKKRGPRDPAVGQKLSALFKGRPGRKKPQEEKDRISASLSGRKKPYKARGPVKRKLTDHEQTAVRAMRKYDLCWEDLALMFGVSRSTIGRILNGYDCERRSAQP
jgi:group I intron endonuclease